MTPSRPARRYTGISDGIGPGARPGLVEFVAQIEARTDRALWNNGTFANRKARGKETLSVHATGRAVDLSYRNMRDGRGKPDGIRVAREWMRLLTSRANEFGLEAILDYQPAPYGRGWRCDRGSWMRYEQPTIFGAPGGDWFHVELSPAMSDDSHAMRTAFERLEVC
jgi:hypothetical protein